MSITPTPLDCFGRPALVVTVADRTYTVTGVDEFGAIRTAEHGTVNPGAVAELDAAVYTSGLWAFARKPKTADAVTVKPVTDTTAESLAVLAVIDAEQTRREQYVAADDVSEVHVHDYTCAIPCEAAARRPAAPTVLPGQRVRITGGRFAGIETTPSEVRASGWLKFHTNARRGYGVQLQSVAPGNWEPVPYSTGLHEFAPEAGGIICVTPCLRPDGTVQACGDPVKGAIHDPQAYAAYATELAAELAKWAAEPVSSEMLIVGSNLRHWGNDEHTACGSAGIMAALAGGNAWCTTCKTVRNIEQV